MYKQPETSAGGRPYGTSTTTWRRLLEEGEEPTEHLFNKDAGRKEWNRLDRKI